jgi:hypothetical protein
LKVNVIADECLVSGTGFKRGIYESPFNDTGTASSGLSETASSLIERRRTSTL